MKNYNKSIVLVLISIVGIFSASALSAEGGDMVCFPVEDPCRKPAFDFSWNFNTPIGFRVKTQSRPEYRRHSVNDSRRMKYKWLIKRHSEGLKWYVESKLAPIFEKYLYQEALEEALSFMREDIENVLTNNLRYSSSHTIADKLKENIGQRYDGVMNEVKRQRQVDSFDGKFFFVDISTFDLANEVDDIKSALQRCS